MKNAKNTLLTSILMLIILLSYGQQDMATRLLLPLSAANKIEAQIQRLKIDSINLDRAESDLCRSEELNRRYESYQEMLWEDISEWKGLFDNAVKERSKAEKSSRNWPLFSCSIQNKYRLPFRLYQKSIIFASSNKSYAKGQ